MKELKLKGEARQVFLKLKFGKSAALLQWLNHLLSCDELHFRHPVARDAAPGFCVGSYLVGDVNLLFFQNNRGGQWVWLQQYSFLDALWVDGELHVLPTTEYGIEALQIAAKTIPTKFDALPDTPVPFKGLLLNHSRPAHYLYDQLANVLHLGLDDAQEVALGSHVFINPHGLLPADIKLTEPKAAACYALPLLDIKNSLNPTLLESALRRAVPSVQAENAGFVLWFGVAGEKRCWQEQIDGCVYVVTKLASSGQPVKVYIDGFTSEHNRAISHTNDVHVFEAIQAQLDGIAEVESLIGATYLEKIACAKGCAGFVTYAGTQCIVPLRIAKLPGVVHSNTRYWVGRDIEGFKLARYVPVDEITDLSSDDLKPDLVNYSINPKVVYRLLLDSLGYSEHNL